jgi:hypothetical protein
MTLSTAPAALAATAARLRSGILTADYAPAAIAALIEALAAERRTMAAEIDDLKQAVSPAAARNAYAAGFRDAVQVCKSKVQTEVGNSAYLEELLSSAQPDFARAGQIAHETAA